MDEEYLGFKDLCLTDEQLAMCYSKDECPSFGCVMNEYLIVRNADDEIVDQFRRTENKFERVTSKTINTRYSGKVKPRNIHQQLAIDMLYNPDITVKMLAGKYGTGKDMLMSAVATDLLEKGKYEKIVYVRNNIEVKDSKPIGHLPGTYNEKLMPYAAVLADKLGGQDSLEMMIGQGRIEIVHLGFIRGRDLKNSIVYCSEAENMTKEHFQLLLGRIGEGSILMINGDCRQTDMEIFKNNSGMKIALERLAGHPRFGYVKLMKTERSETAAMADLLD